MFADSEDPDKTARMRRLIWASIVRICPKVRFRLAWHIWPETVYLSEGLDRDYWVLINDLILLTTEFCSKILVTTDFCDAEFNNEDKKSKIYWFLRKLLYSITNFKKS